MQTVKALEEIPLKDAEALTETIAVRLPLESMEALRAAARASQRAPAALVREWVLDQLYSGRSTPESEQHPVPAGDADERREELRERYRPGDIEVLFVGESAPAGGTFFYQADSNLFFATREACDLAFHGVPEGRAFLRWFKARSFWLYDLAGQPVNRKRGRPRKLAVSAGVSALAELIEEVEPDFVVAVKRSIEADVRQAAERAAFEGNRVVVLPFPLYQWRDVYVRELARFFGHGRRRRPKASASPQADDVATSGGRPLHEAMIVVLNDAGLGPFSARELANEVAARKLYVRHDGGRADYQQILARARRYPQIFAVDRSGVRLR